MNIRDHFLFSKCASLHVRKHNQQPDTAVPKYEIHGADSNRLLYEHLAQTSEADLNAQAPHVVHQSHKLHS